jgi:hypothetical protein
VKALSKTHINTNLRRLDVLFKAATNPRDSLFLSKLAILELCGWIEISMDAIARRCVKKRLRIQNSRLSAESVIQNTFSFEYQRHFRKMLIHIIGLDGFDKIERKLDPIQLQKLRAGLDALKINRDREAHTYIKGITVNIDAPSVTRGRFNDIYDALDHFDKTMKKVGF